MLKLFKRSCVFLWALFYVVQIIVLGLIIVLSVADPQNNLFPWQMGLGTALGAAALLTAVFVWEKIPLPKAVRSNFFYGILLALFGVLLFAVSCANRNSVYSNWDYPRLWNAALELSQGKPVSDTIYFKTYANNIKPTLYLSLIFRAADFLHIGDPFYLILPLSVLEVVGAVWSVNILAWSSAEERAKYRIPVLLLFAFTLPIWANVQAFYTDSMSFVMGVISLALFKLGLESPLRLKSVLLSILAGSFLGLGISVKVTVLIPVIAGFIVFCFSRPSAKGWGLAGVFLLGAGILYGATSLYAEGFEIWRDAKETSEPFIDWIALGMKGEGNYGSNIDYIEYVKTLPSKEEKTRYTLNYIWENRSDFLDLSHLAQKIRCNFASGHLGATDFAYRAQREHNLLWECFSPDGKHFWRTSQLCFCYLFSFYAVCLLGAGRSLYGLVRRRELPAVKALADLSFFGMFLFLMLWEANNRQLYNQAPVLILGAVLNARYILLKSRG